MGLRTHKSRASPTLRIIYVRQIHHCQTAGPANSDTASAPISRRVHTGSRMHCNGLEEPRRLNLAYRNFGDEAYFRYRDIMGWMALEEDCGMIREWGCEGLLPARIGIYRALPERRIMGTILRLGPAHCFLRWIEDAFQGSAHSITEDSRRLI
jgi:hypothetical protein